MTQQNGIFLAVVVELPFGPVSQVLPGPGLRSIQSADADSGKRTWFEISRVYRQDFAASPLSVRVVGHATTGFAMKVCANLAAPGVTGQAAGGRFDSN